ncbi:uncharacterized protein [Hyperolius riggenbachi]|uniref:uncharacterized protein n=1 Tax=Hyperolius riggenbachi TaxID=752182 RepID=UPI0035A3CF42
MGQTGHSEASLQLAVGDVDPLSQSSVGTEMTVFKRSEGSGVHGSFAGVVAGMLMKCQESAAQVFGNMDLRQMPCWQQSWRCQSDTRKVPDANLSLENSEIPEIGKRLKHEIPESGKRLKHEIPEMGKRLKTEVPEIGKRLKELSEQSIVQIANVFLSQGGAFIMRSTVLMVILGCHFVLGERREDILMYNKGLMRMQGPSMLMFGDKGTNPFTPPSAWHRRTMQGRRKRALVPGESKFHGTRWVKGLKGQVCGQWEFNGSVNLLLNATLPESMHRSKGLLKGTLQYNGYMQKVECVIQGYLVLVMQSEMGPDWRGTSRRCQFSYQRDAGDHITLWSYQQRVPLKQPYTRKGWKAKGGWFSKQEVKIEIKPHFQVTKRVGRAVPGEGKPTQGTPFTPHGSQQGTILHSPYAAAYPHDNWVSEEVLLIERLQRVQSSRPQVHSVPQDIRGEVVQSGQLGTYFVSERLDKGRYNNFSGEGSFAWQLRDVWVNKWKRCNIPLGTATSLVPTSTRVLHQDLRGQPFLVLDGEVKQVELSSCGQFLQKYLRWPGQVKFSEEACRLNNAECEATIQKIHPEAQPIVPVAEGKVWFFNIRSNDTFKVYSHNCSDKGEFPRGTYCVSGDPIWILSSRFDDVVSQIVKRTLKVKVSRVVPVLKENPTWDKGEQGLIQDDHILLQRLNKQYTKLEVRFHHDTGDLNEVEHKNEQVSSSLPWWTKVPVMFQGHSDGASAVPKFFLHPLVVWMGMTTLGIIVQVRLRVKIT